MQIFANPHHARHSARHEMFRGKLVPVHEVPARMDFVLAELARRPVGELHMAPPPITQAQLERVHARRYLDFLRTAWTQWVALDPANDGQDALPSVWPVRGFRADVEPDYIVARMGLHSFDSGTPLVAGTWVAAETGAACAIAAALALGRGTDAPRATMALTRPPGHHAGHDFYGGYCFLNNAALATQTLLDRGARRVAVLDVDYHHGNGTQSLFYERSDVLTVSIHGDPRTEYPFYLGHADERGAGEGEGCNLNVPLPRGTGFARWHAELMSAMQRIADFGPDALVVALGVDTFEGDPISHFRLASVDYLQVGRDIASMGLPAVFTLEGGYAVDAMGINVVNVLEGFCTASVRG